ncbi:MAG TPA: NADP-dependent malic enzyme [Edaphocola sp.]|nr:NADP-dependent malic enzyme [Edaphocola sp.]
MENKNLYQEALDYHSNGRPGKIKVVPTKNTKTQKDLSLAYSPGVAAPCLAIKENIEDVYKYTAKGNLVAVISNGTAVLGLGNIGPEAGKPVMEGKGLLFKIFADIDVFDLELNTTEIEPFIQVVKALEPTFGGINLEDIKAPECFEIERRLKQEMNIPVMHDDQHGTAMISGAALLNALEIVEKDISQVKIVVSGAGAAAVACSRMYIKLGAKKENIFMFDIDGIINNERTDLDPDRMYFAQDISKITMADAMKDADVMIGLSAGNIVSQDMVRAMAKDPIVFAMANPNPEIPYDDAVTARPDIIMATGRSDYPNQVNNVLGFPFIFRGALDVRATAINDEMKIAAAYALAALAKQPVPDLVTKAYGKKTLNFGRDYIIPKPLDPRLLSAIAPAIAKAAMESGVARKPIEDFEVYKKELNDRLGINNSIIRLITAKAKISPQRIVFAEADNFKVLQAAQIVEQDGYAFPILLGDKKKIEQIISENNINFKNPVIIDPRSDEFTEKRALYGEQFFTERPRKGMNIYEAKKIMRERNYFGCMMVANGEADGFISGLTRNYPDTIRPALSTIGKAEGVNRVAGMYIVLTPKGPLFLADTTINFNPNAEELAEIAQLTANEVAKFGLEPKVAMLSYSNFGSSNTPEAKLMGDAARIAKANNPSLIIDGEIQAGLAFNSQVLKENYPFSDLVSGGVNTLIFPNLAAGNIAYNLLEEVAEFDIIGPILIGLKKPAHILQLGSSVQQIVNMVVMTAFDAQTNK